MSQRNNDQDELHEPEDSEQEPEFRMLGEEFTPRFVKEPKKRRPRVKPPQQKKG